jgi:FtsZ-binding cell division protein ZapB
VLLTIISQPVSSADIKQAIEHLEKEYQALNDNYDGLLGRYKSIPSSLLVSGSVSGEKEQLAERLREMLGQMEEVSVKIAKLRDIQRKHGEVPRSPRSRSVASMRRSASVGRQARGSSVLSTGTASEYNRQAARELQRDLQEMTKSIENLEHLQPPGSPRRHHLASPSAKQSQILRSAEEVDKRQRHRSRSGGQLSLSGRLSPAKVALEIFRDAKRVQQRLVDWQDVDHAVAFGGQPIIN